MARSGKFSLLLLIVLGCKPHIQKYSPEMERVMNLKQIDGAKATWALEHHKTTNDLPTDGDLFGANAYVYAKPTCPSGGSYTTGKVGERPTCNVTGHQIPYIH